MNKRQKLVTFSLFGILFIVLIAAWLHGHPIAVLSPKGPVAQKERNLIVLTSALSLLVIIPVYIMTASIAWKYRETNKKARYTPDWDHNVVIETIWWGIPLVLISVLSVITWRSSHDLDPFKPLASKTPAITVQVVALDWKWLFIYPDAGIASVNYLQIPVNTPVNFQITADAPMNSFWIPQLGGQIYAMSGMSSELNLEASQAGSYRGVSANISGRGFAGMNFIAKASSSDEYKAWLGQASQSTKALDMNEYSRLVRPSENNRPSSYYPVAASLYDRVVSKYAPFGHSGIHAGGQQ